VAFNNALYALKVQLQDKGFTYSDAYPYFAAKNWGSGQYGANTMGAAFNYKLFLAEPGAYTHSPEYAKQLIIDSIVAVANNGDVNGAITIDSALNDLYGKGLITNDQVSSITDYISPAVKIPVNCTACHPTLSSSHTAHVGNLLSQVTAYGTADSHYTANSSDSSGYKFGCVYCHPYVNANHTNGAIVLSGNGFQQATKVSVTCNAAACHSDGKGSFVTSPDWYTGFTGGDRCAMCHAASPTTGSHAAHTSINGIHDGSSGITYAVTYSCVKCHANTVDGAKTINYANHVNGSVNVAFVAASEVSKAQISAASFNKYSTVWTRTGSTDTSKLPLSAGSYAGGTCSTIACHNNSTTPAWGTAVRISCVDCHSAL
jgi:predicted CxxxxCH...CXXCH cytochrome family protein